MKKIFTISVLLAFIGLNVFAQINLDSGLVAKYYFNGNAIDESGNGNFGTVNGATLTIDRFGNSNRAYYFDGVDDYIDLENTSTLNMFSEFSLVAWVNYTYNNGGAIISKHINYYANGFSMGAGGGGGIANNAHLTTDPLNYFISTAETYNDSTWHLFVGICRNDTISLYVDGIFKVSGYSGYSIGNDINIRIGKSSDLGPFHGIIDDIRIYNRTLSDLEIRQLYEEVSTSVKDNIGSPSQAILNQNYPNPFNPVTTISFSLPLRSFISLKVFDVLSNEIATLMDEEKEAGYHSVDFNASDLPSGVYFYRLETADFVQARKLLLVK
ncbi:MAG: T9SS type A sorting domain-containing protein [Bacteroidetes bacterium]|nr:T9SS type A sorting domain-containing protein [Bacteroidota bacterium]MBU2508686.1 T9SS type A sorting domain-containing protein [Bacteroidota bacterium]